MTPALRGILLMVAAIGFFVSMDTIAKYLSQWYPVPGIVWARYVINLGILLAWFAARGEIGRLRTARPGIQFARGFLLAAATSIYFTSLKVLPLADAAAISFVMPLFVAALAVPMLGERLDLPRMMAIFVGLAGALIIVRPGSDVFTPYALLPVAMALCNALYQVLTRKVAGIEHPFTSLIWGALVGAVLLSAVAPFAWKTPETAWHWTLLGVIGLLASVGHYLLIKAYDCASAMLLASEDWARARKLPILAWFRAGKTWAVDFASGHEGLLMAPAYSVSSMLQDTGLTLQDFDYYEIHEAFAAVPLCLMKAWESPEYCRERLGRSAPLGSIDRSKLNVKGGSVAIGHPFAATGARILGVLAKLLANDAQARRGLASACTAGGMGVSAILEKA